MRWYRKAAAGNNSAKHNIGLLHREGLGVVEDYVEAVTWFRAANDKVPAFSIVPHGIVRNAEEAAYWRGPEARAGDIAAIKELARYYENGES